MSKQRHKLGDCPHDREQFCVRCNQLLQQIFAHRTTNGKTLEAFNKLKECTAENHRICKDDLCTNCLNCNQRHPNHHQKSLIFDTKISEQASNYVSVYKKQNVVSMNEGCQLLLFDDAY